MNGPVSPYAGKPEQQWEKITQRLLARHPLKPREILDVASVAWSNLWQTTIGTSQAVVRLSELAVPAQVVGYFFEVLFARELETRFPGQWRGQRTKDEKDLVYVPNGRFSVELKTSGQMGFKIFGNRSHGQELRDPSSGKKEKSGYYITINFVGKTITLMRFGWIDATDWKPQASPTGQMAGLSNAVYAHKLRIVPGDYRMDAPVRVLRGIGEKLASQLDTLGTRNIRDLIAFKGSLSPMLEQIRRDAIVEYLGAP
jgi:hypothetical protein